MANNKSLADDFFALNLEQRRLVHFVLCEHALEKWNLYSNAHEKIEYMETVASTRQEVDKKLPFDSFISAKQGSDSQNIAQRYREPIVAMQDEDLTFPENVTFAYYAIYNLFKKYAEQEVVDDWLIVNQALSSEDDSEVGRALFNRAIQMIKQ